MSHVGIFWFVPANLFSLSALVVDMAPLAEATDRNGVKVHNLYHADYWTNLAGMGARNLRRCGLPLIIASADYDTFPRGRIEYDPSGQDFLIYADRRLHDWAFLQYVVAVFGIPDDRFTVETDPDYASIEPLGPPKPWY